MAKEGEKGIWHGSRPRGNNLFKRNDVMRAIKSARDSGISVECVEVVCKDGTTIRVVGRKSSDENINPWDTVLTNAANQKRAS